MIIEFLQYPFVQRALIAGVILALVFALLGVYVTLRQMAFWGEGIAHASLAGIALALLVGGSPLFFALIVAVIFAVSMFLLERKTKLSNDALIGVLFTSFMALGIVLLSLQKQYQPELLSYLFGNILTISTSDVYIISIVGLLIVSILLLAHRHLSLLMLDKTSAYLAGVKTETLELLFYIILAMAVVLGVKMLGVVLVSALLIIPPSIAKILARSYRSLRILSVVFAELIVIIGFFISLSLNVPSGPAIILTGSVLFLLATLITRKS